MGVQKRSTSVIVLRLRKRFFIRRYVVAASRGFARHKTVFA